MCSTLISNFRMTIRMPSEEWLRVWIYLSFILGLSKSARPRFDTSTDMGMVLVPADAEVDSVIFRLRATDEDADLPLVFDITATVTPIVRIENLPCTLYNKICQANVILTKKLTAGRLHDFAVRVRDSKGDSNSMQATISVTNATTQRDKIFPHIPTIIMVPEDTKPGKELDYILVRSNPWSGKPVYIELWQPKELFTIRQRQTPTQTRGVITLIGELDFETQSMYTLTMYATDPYTEMKKDTRNIAGLQLVVIVKDVQDVPPIFTQAPPLTKINNTIQPGDLILRVHAEDGDKGVPREVAYGLVSEGNPFTPFFNISESTGEIILARPLEELTQITHIGAPIIISVVAEEIRRSQEESPAQATVVELGLLLGEPGNSPPYFENDNYVAWMDENSEPGSSVIFNEPYSNRVKDEDIGKAGVFALKLENNNGTFEINPAVAERSTNFILSVRDNSLIDYELYKSLQFKIVAQEVGPATNLSAAVPVTIFLRDVNDNLPEFQQELYEMTLSENVTVGTRVVRVHATDKDTGSFGRIQYTQIIGLGSEAFAINPDTGIISVAMDTNILDREITPQLQLTVEARDEDGRGLRGSVPLIINLLDVNDNAPIFQKNNYDFVLNEDSTNFSIPAIIKAVDADAESPNNEVRYELIHGNYENIFFLDEITGQLFLRKQITKIINTRHNYHQRSSTKFRRSIFPQRNFIHNFLNSRNKTTSLSENYDAKQMIIKNGIEKLIRRKRQNRDVLFTMTARAYDLGVPHLSGTTQINILQTPSAAARIVMFVVLGENPDPVKTAQTLATITGGQITVQEIRPYTPGSFLNDYDTTLPSTDGAKRSIVIARVEPIGTGTSLVDIEKIRTALAANGVGVISGDMPSQNPDYRNHDGTKINSSNTITTIHSEEVTIYKAENKLLFWLLIILGLLILLVIIALIICCICPGCPFYMAPRKRKIHSSETLLARPEGRPKRQTFHRKYPIMMQATSCSGKKQAWSADPMQLNWQFNRRNTKNYGLASLPGDIIRVCDPQDGDYPRKAMSLRGEDCQLPIYMPDNPIRMERQRRFHMEDIGDQKNRRYDVPSEMIRAQHYYRDGNAEVMRLVTRGGAEETSVTMHKPPKVIIDQAVAAHRNDGKDILLRRFIEDQKLRVVNKEFQEDIQEEFERQSMESHQKQREIAMQRQQKSEILLIPDKLEQDQHQHVEELGGDIQRLIIDHGIYEKADRLDTNEPQDIPVGRTLLIPMAKITEKKREQSGLMNMQEYNVHEFELAKQNALLTRLLLEKDSRIGVGLVDSASYLETQSLPGQVAAGTQTDQTTATQTEQPNRSRSDNESEEDSRMRRKIKSKKRYGDESKRIKILWMKSPIQEEEHLHSDKRTILARRKIKDVKDGRKISIEPEVLREISDSLDENDKSNTRYESVDDEKMTPMKDSSSVELIKAPKKLTRQRKTEEAETKNMKTKRDTELEPSLRILEKEMSSLGKKLAILTKQEVERKMDSQMDEKIQDYEKSREAESKCRKKKMIQGAVKSISKEQSEISNDDSSGKSNEKVKMRKTTPVNIATSGYENTVEKFKTRSKIYEKRKCELPTVRKVYPKLQKHTKIKSQLIKNVSDTEKFIESETESGTVKMSSSELDQSINDEVLLNNRISKDAVEIPKGKNRQNNEFRKSSKTRVDELKQSIIIDSPREFDDKKHSNQTSIDTIGKEEIIIPDTTKSSKCSTDDDTVAVDISDQVNVKSSTEIMENEQMEIARRGTKIREYLINPNIDSQRISEIESIKQEYEPIDKYRKGSTQYEINFKNEDSEVNEGELENDHKEKNKSVMKTSMNLGEFAESSKYIKAVEKQRHEITGEVIEFHSNPMEFETERKGTKGDSTKKHTETRTSNLSKLGSNVDMTSETPSREAEQIMSESKSIDPKMQQTIKWITEHTPDVKGEDTEEGKVLNVNSAVEFTSYRIDDENNEMIMREFDGEQNVDLDIESQNNNSESTNFPLHEVHQSLEALSESERKMDDKIAAEYLQPPASLGHTNSKVTLLTPQSSASIDRRIQDNDSIPTKLERDNGNMQSTQHLNIPAIEFQGYSDIETAKPIKIIAEESECQVLETSSIKSDHSNTSKSITIIRETSFLNSPKKEGYKDYIKEPKLEEMQVDELPTERINQQISHPRIGEPAASMSIEESAAKLKYSKPDTEARESTGLSHLPESQVSEENSDLSSESSIKTTFIAQPYGTPRHKQLVENLSSKNSDDNGYNYDNILKSSAIQAVISHEECEGITTTSELKIEKKGDEKYCEKDINCSFPQENIPNISHKIKLTEAANIVDGIQPQSGKFDIISGNATENERTKTAIKFPEEIDKIKSTTTELSSKTSQEISIDGEAPASLPGLHPSIKERDHKEITDVTKVTIDEAQSHLQSSPGKSAISLKKKTEDRNWRHRELATSKIEKTISQKNSAQAPISHGTKKFRSQDTLKPRLLRGIMRNRSDEIRISRKLEREKDIHSSKATIERTKKNLTKMPNIAHNETKAVIDMESPGSPKKIKKISELGLIKASTLDNKTNEPNGISLSQINQLTDPSLMKLRPEQSSSQVEVVSAVKTMANTLPTIIGVETMIAEENIENDCQLMETGTKKLSDILEESIQNEAPNVVITRKNIPIISTDSPQSPILLDGAIGSPNAEIKSKNSKEEITEAQSRYMAWYKEIQERKEGEAEIEEPPKWLRKNTRQRWLKMSLEDRKAFDLKTPDVVTPRPRRKIKPLKNVESEQLKAIVRQGRRLRRTEVRKNDDPPIEIFAPEKPPISLILSPQLKHHYLIQHSEYKYEKITPPFYLHPPPVPHSSPQVPTQNFEDKIEHSSKGSRCPDEDMKSEILVPTQPGNRLRHQQLLEKKSVFDIAYSEAAPSHLRTDSTTPPS